MPQPFPYRICARAPLRLDLAGAGTDLPALTGRQPGRAVAAALSLDAHVEVLLGGRTIKLHAEDRAEHVTAESAAALVYDGRLDLLKAALNMMPITGGVEILVRIDAPPGSGLGAAGALSVALLAALAQGRQEDLDPHDLAELAFRLQVDELHRSAGRLDSHMAALGGMRLVSFREETVTERLLELPPAVAPEFETRVLVACGSRRYPAEKASRDIMERYQAGEAGVTEAVHSLVALVDEAASALEAGAWQTLDRIVNAAFLHQQKLDPLLTLPSVRATMVAAREAGATAIKAAGARPGAGLLVLGPPDRQAAIRSAMRAAGASVLSCTLAPRGVEVWLEELPA